MPRDQAAYASKVLARPSAREGATPTAFVASASRITTTANGKPFASKKPKVQAWQSDAWILYDEVAEYRYACQWVGNLLSKAVLIAWEDGKPTTNQAALDAMASLFGGREGQKEMLRQNGIHFTAVGEAYIIGAPAEPDDEDQDDKWLVGAAYRMQKIGPREQNSWKLGDDRFLDALVIRLWRPHPARHEEADSPSRPLLSTLRQIDKLSRHVDAQLDSRLSGAGLLLVPSEMSFPTTEGTSSSSAAAFLAELIETMSEAISDPSSPAAKVPTVLQANGEHIKNVTHLKFWSDLDEKAGELQKEAIGRFALGMDMPPEIITGTGDMNHWGSWQVEEASIKAHTEPLLSIITSSLTTGYLWPALLASGVSREDLQKFTIHADTAEMRLRPNRSKEAVELYDRGELSGAALRRENGFDETDKMETDEFQQWQLKKIASGSSTPEMVDAAARALGVHLPLPPVPGGVMQVKEKVTEARPTPSLEEHPTRELPDTADDALVAAAELHIGRALERAGNKMKTMFGIKAPSAISAYQVAELDAPDIDKVMEDAWSLVGFGRSVAIGERELRAMDAYTRTLIATGADHSPKLLRRYLSETL